MWFIEKLPVWVKVMLLIILMAIMCMVFAIHGLYIASKRELVVSTEIHNAIARLPHNEPEPIAYSKAIQEVIEAQKELNEAFKALLEAERALIGFLKCARPGNYDPAEIFYPEPEIEGVQNERTQTVL